MRHYVLASQLITHPQNQVIISTKQRALQALIHLTSSIRRTPKFTNATFQFILARHWVKNAENERVMAHTRNSENPRFGHLTTKLSSFSPGTVSLDNSDGNDDLLFGAFNCSFTSSPEFGIVGARFRHFRISDLKIDLREDSAE